MTIKEAEEKTGLTRSNIRFYEKEKLIEPARNSKNGYRDYSEQDVANIKKIAFLRTLEFSIEDIRCILSHKVSLEEMIKKQAVVLLKQIENLHGAKTICEKMLASGNTSYDELQVETCVTDLHTYWKDNKKVVKPDSVSFLYLWGNLITWTIITALCLIIGILSYTKLPAQIPVQWSGKAAVSFVKKEFIFAYPLACILFRIRLRPVIYVRLFMHYPFGELITEYLSNYVCFAALSIEVFSILFLHGLAKNVTVVLLLDTAVLMGLLIVGIAKMGLLSNPAKLWKYRKS